MYVQDIRLGEISEDGEAAFGSNVKHQAVAPAAIGHLGRMEVHPVQETVYADRITDDEVQVNMIIDICVTK